MTQPPTHRDLPKCEMCNAALHGNEIRMGLCQPCQEIEDEAERERFFRNRVGCAATLGPTGRKGCRVVKERGILFSSEMVRALLDGQKSQTRRVAKRNAAGRVELKKKQWHIEDPKAVLACPYGQPGDRLWVRESFRRVCSGEIRDGEGKLRYGLQYKADNTVVWSERETVMSGGWTDTDKPMQFRDVPWKPSIHLPKSASRITLEIVSVRVERVQSISQNDARAEGCRDHSGDPCEEGGLTPVDCYRYLWDRINAKKHPWSANPWCWIISFRRVKP